ncbi:hypothetical protein RZO55_14425 [Clostridium boliviensis]|uniref:Uncharacterized protein n=1 Tax=Clostridium boliviensis TaxID=318465 RepID=A0ABU4GMD8_9CLOT|nr:hypothetical protein [Clostridium boliviensis]MDW2798771.1 hypothetical protein [Clostridium boliviensis]
MKKIVKLLGETFPGIIDLFYGILKSIVGEVPIEFMGAEFQKGTFSQSVKSCFSIYITFRIFCFFMIIKLGLMIITSIFKISTRHFGSFEKETIHHKQAFAVATGTSKEVTKS